MRADPLLVGTLLVLSLPAGAATPAPAPSEPAVADATDPAEDPVASLHGEIGALARQIAELRAQVSVGWPAPDPADGSSDGALIHASPPAPPPEPPSAAVEREARIVAAQADLVAARQRLARLQALVAGGIDGDLLAPSVADAEARVGTLEAAVAAAEADGGTSTAGPSSGAGESLAGAPPPEEAPVAEPPVAEAPVAEAPVAELPAPVSPAAEVPAAQAALATAPAEPVPTAEAPAAAPANEAADAAVVADAEPTGAAGASEVVSVASVDSPDQPAASVCSFSVGLGSAYVFRGLNVLSEGSPEDQDGIVAPAARCGIGSTGLSVGYWGAYQVSGANAHAAVQAGLGNEQDIILGFDRTVGDHGVGLSASVVAYVYPFADPEVAGTASPLYLEPGVGLRTGGDVVVSYKMSYMIGVQDAVAASRYVYMNPSIARAWTLADGWDLDLTASAGLKAYTTDIQPTDNIVDVQLDAVVPHAFSDRFAVAPGVHGAASHAGGEPTFTAWLSLDSNFNL